MTFRDELDQVADQAPPVGDLADRALRDARRRRRRVHLPVAAGVAAVAIALLAAVVVRPALFSMDFAPAEPWQERTEVPATAPPLPSGGTHPAKLAYLWNCSKSGSEQQTCFEPRVMTQDDKHWVVREVRPRVAIEGVPGKPEITLSPDGRQLVYTDGPKFVRRDLMTGEVTDLVTILPTNNSFGQMAWSPDSRWLVLCFNPGEGQRSTLIDLQTGQRVPLDGWPIGLPNGAEVMPFTDSGRMDEGMVLPLRDRSGAAKGTIPTSVLGAPGPFTPEGMVSPDGRSAALSFGAGPYNPPRIVVVGVSPPRAVDQINFPTGEEPLAFPYVLGWLDNSRFLYATHWLEEAWTLPTRHDLRIYDAATGESHLVTELAGRVEIGTVSIATDLL